jgi:hypothetical protein
MLAGKRRVITVKLAFGALCGMHFEVVKESLMPIRLQHHDKNSTTTQQFEISLVMPEEIPFSQMSNAPLKAMFGLLYGSTER